MTRFSTHDLKPGPTRDEQAAQDFVSSRRHPAPNPMAISIKNRFDADVGPGLAENAISRSVPRAMQQPARFKFCSAAQVIAAKTPSIDSYRLPDEDEAALPTGRDAFVKRSMAPIGQA